MKLGGLSSSALCAGGIVLLLASPALADVVNPPPSSCPRGSEPSTSHAGPHCRPKTCSSSASCTAPEVCDALPLCIVKLPAGGMGTPPGTTIDAVEGACDPAGNCSKGACEQRKVCAEPASASERGCACSSASSPSGWALLSVLLGLGLMLALRRRPSARRDPRARG